MSDGLWFPRGSWVGADQGWSKLGLEHKTDLHACAPGSKLCLVKGGGVRFLFRHTANGFCYVPGVRLLDMRTGCVGIAVLEHNPLPSLTESETTSTLLAFDEFRCRSVIQCCHGT